MNEATRKHVHEEAMIWCEGTRFTAEELMTMYLDYCDQPNAEEYDLATWAEKIEGIPND